MGSSAIIFGAGNVGRGFLGQLFSESGYQVVFVDVDAELVAALDDRGRYTVRLVDNDRLEEVVVTPVGALLAGDAEAVAGAVAMASIAATAVGVRALPFVAPVLAAGITQRAAAGVAAPLNIIICENLKDAAATLRGMVEQHLPAALHPYLHTHIGFVDTVIGRMVPPLTPELRAADPTLILVEPYKVLPVDRAAWIGPVPLVVGLEACDNFPAYTARKLYIHNCGHAVLSYLGHLAGHEYGYQALADPAIRPWFDAALAESKAGIVAVHGVDPAWLDAHIADLTRRFANRALGDTVLRLGRDPLRKLESEDRLVGAARLAERARVVPNALARTIAAAYRFDDPRDPLAVALQERLAAEGFDAVLAAVSGIQPDEPLAGLVRAHYQALASDPLPPPLMTSELGSFARGTIVERKPQIMAQVIADNDYAAEIVAVLHGLRDEIAAQPMQPLHEPADDTAFWNAELARYAGRTWLEVPWYFAETFFYRKLLEAVRYLQPGPWRGRDPFGRQKRQQEADALARLEASWDQLAGLAADVLFETLLHSCLWGNRADLSNLTVTEQAQAGLATQNERHLLLIDHTAEVHALLAEGVQRVDFINDNVGLDSLFDLALADFRLAHGWAQQVVMHLKDRPFFVSDAMPQDIETVLAALAASTSPSVRSLAARLMTAQAAERLRFQSDPFWTSFQMFRDMPEALQADIAAAELAIVKGDVNYRRLLDDRHWPPTTRMEAVAGYFPTSFVALRTLKGEIMVGLATGQAERLSAEDPDWMINGKRGVVHCVKRATQNFPYPDPVLIAS
ncbi:MAG TPA: ARMT1-like domain-containing protein [Anaerolineae bacterium]|nr:ARMT1-like domain-containing protein [Anaerolineae bacterium]